MAKPKIFIFVATFCHPEVVAAACAEDGTLIAEHLSSHLLWARQDMGLMSDQHYKRRLYDEYYPEGYKIVDLLDLTDEQLANHVELQAALALGIEKMNTETKRDERMTDYIPPPNPYSRDGKWFWYDETEYEFGPYDTLQQADEALKNYIEFLDHPEDVGKDLD